LNAVAVQDPPDVVARDIAQRPRQELGGPPGTPSGRLLIQRGQHPALHLSAVAPRRPRPRRIVQSRQSVRRKARAPLADRRRTHPIEPGNALSGGAGRRGQHNAPALRQSLLGGRSPHPTLQQCTIVSTQLHRCGGSSHAATIPKILTSFNIVRY
jgi:hypothetical protein